MKQIVAATVPGLTISRLRALTAVADEGPYAAAVRRLGPSHTAVARQIRDLEGAFGQTIFDRANGRLSPSPVGRELSEIGERILMKALRSINREDVLMVLVNRHTLDTAREYCSRIIAMRAGRGMFDGLPRQLTDDIVRDIYGNDGLADFNDAATSNALRPRVPA